MYSYAGTTLHEETGEEMAMIEMADCPKCSTNVGDNLENVVIAKFGTIWRTKSKVESSIYPEECMDSEN